MKQKLQQWWQRATTWCKHHPWETGSLVLLLVIGAFLRFYNLSNSLMFQADQGRDALVVSEIFTKLDPVFIGPTTSVGNMYLGPLYYYLMLIPLMMTYPSPVGPAYFVALLGVVTIALIYLLGRKVVGHGAAWLAAIFYTFSAVTIEYSRFSWNPNPVGIFMILLIYFLYLAWRKKYWAWIGAIAMCGCLIQLHYVNLLAVAATGVIWLICLWNIFQENRKKLNQFPVNDEILNQNSWQETLKEKEIVSEETAQLSKAERREIYQKEIELPEPPKSEKIINKIGARQDPNISTEHQLKKFFGATAVGAVIFVVLLIPLALFTLKHGNLFGLSSFQEVFPDQQVITDANGKKIAVEERSLWAIIKETHGRSGQIIGDVGFAHNDSQVFKTLLVMLVLGYLIYLVGRERKETSRTGIAAAMLLIFLVVSILGIAVYSHSVFDHYILFTGVITFLSYGLILNDLWRRWWGKIMALIFVMAFIFMNAVQYNFFTAPSMTWKQMSQVAAAINEEIGPDTKYVMVLSGPSRDSYGQNYYYFLSTHQNNLLNPAHLGEAEKLVVIDEYNQPNFNWNEIDSYEIKSYAPERIVDSFRPLINGPTVYILEKDQLE